ncbi:hypothetical protein FVR03_05540 [Pontibacter qinzhouensis]|uniref:Uncharacterized protein n=1 Tax=Pontibacter qinzhouensis TaxID=2603253 RepID=A0A5C8KB56_9BACT|nr:hypothetical protein [Pontibacter qinzhouensis]TXK50065.1 hypothetical protein FVR03_05540 [Pontibacter qinzhouensis]
MNEMRLTEDHGKSPESVSAPVSRKITVAKGDIYSRMKQFRIFLSLVSLVVCFFITANNEASLLTELTKALAIIACLNLIRILPKTS